MTTLSNGQFAERVLALATPDRVFVPHAVPDKDGDCIEFLAKPDPFYAERIDDLVTVYYSQETNEVIGALVKGVSRFCEKMFAQFPGFQIEIVDGKIKLACLFRANAWATKRAPGPTLTYKKLIEVAEESGVEAELCASLT